MGKSSSFWKSIAGSLLRIAMLLLITVGSLLFLVMIYSVIIGDLPPERNNVRITFNPSLMHGYGKARHVEVEKTPWLESIKDMYMGWKYGTEYFNAKFNQQNRRDRTTFTEKVWVANPVMVNWDTKLADFCKNTGFKGKIDNQEIKNSDTWKERSFYAMEGSFNLAEPMDTVSFRRNADFLVKNVLAIFAGEKAGFNLSKQPIYIEPRYYSNASKQVIGYHASYGQLLEQKIPHLNGIWSIDTAYGLNISYNIETMNYQIFNQLFTIPASPLPDKIGRQKALKLAQKAVKERNNLSASELDTLSAEIWKEYIVKYPETKSPHYYYVQSIWFVNFPWAKYSDSFVGFDITYNDVFLVDAYSGKVCDDYSYPF